MMYVRFKIVVLAVEGILLAAICSLTTPQGISCTEWGISKPDLAVLVTAVGLALGLLNELYARLRRSHTHVLRSDLNALFAPAALGILAFLVFGKDPAMRVQGMTAAVLFAAGYLLAVSVGERLAQPVRKWVRPG